MKKKKKDPSDLKLLTRSVHMKITPFYITTNPCGFVYKLKHRNQLFQFHYVQI